MHFLFILQGYYSICKEYIVYNLNMLHYKHSQIIYYTFGLDALIGWNL